MNNEAGNSLVFVLKSDTMKCHNVSTSLLHLILLIFFFASVLSCSNNSPIIEQTISSHIINFDSQSQTISLSFAVFAATQDKDGSQDIDSMYILDDTSQLLWFLSGKDLQVIDNDNRHWIGNKDLKSATGESTPSGKLRIIVYDRAGNKIVSETGLILLEKNLTALIPHAKRFNGNLEIDPGAEWDKMDREIIVLDWSGAELSRFRANGTTIKLDTLSNGKKLDGLKFMIYDNLFNGSLIISSGPW